ncbi:MAG TPA: C-GCAxxG-C-C family protein [Vicinamibacterales bacterium]|jgi:C_GCAxxG_C_C family probable redox protein
MSDAVNGKVEAALGRFAEGYSCSQAVLTAFVPGFGLEADRALRLASAFGGGIARNGEMCGAVTGALMALGLARGKADNEEPSKAALYSLANDFLTRFREQHGSVQCRDLIGCSIGTPEGLQAARDRNVFKDVCPRLVGDAARILSALLEEPPAGG